MAERVLIVAPAWIGDMVMAASVVARLAELHPGAPIDLVAPPWTAPLGSRIEGVGETFALPSAHGRFGLGPRLALARRLRARRYDLALVLPRSWKSALIPFLAGARRRRGYLGEMRVGLLTEPRLLDKTRLPRTVDRFVALAEDDGRAPVVHPPRLVASAERQAALRDRFGLARPFLALAPGAEYGPAKQWPAASFAALAAAAIREGYDVAVFGSAKEAALGGTIAAAGAAAGGRVVSLCGETTLLDAVDLIAAADGVVSNDSGLMHVAAATGRRLVAIYGSSSPAMTPPLGEAVRIAEIDLPCRPCFERTCPLGHLGCLTGISPQAVGGLIFPLMAAGR